MQKNCSLQLCTAPAPPQQSHQSTLPTLPQTKEHAGSSASSSHIPTAPDLSNRRVIEQAILSAIQSMAANPDYSDLMGTMEHHWHGLRTIAFPQVTIPNIPASSVNSISHANAATDQSGHPQYGASERSRSPSCASTSSQKRERGERRLEPRKRNERSLTRPKMPPPQNLRNSPSSNPPPVKKAANEKTPMSKSSQLKSVVSEASVLPPPPPPPPPQIPEPTPPPQSSSRSNLLQRATPRPQTSRAPQSPSVGYQGTSDPQRTVKDIMSEYLDVKVKNGGPTGTPLRKQAIQTPGGKKTFTRPPICSQCKIVSDR